MVNKIADKRNREIAQQAQDTYNRIKAACDLILAKANLVRLTRPADLMLLTRNFSEHFEAMACRLDLFSSDLESVSLPEESGD